MQPPAQELVARDLHDNVWTFRHIYRGQPKRHLLTTGWSVFVSAKRLVAGDSVLFIRDEKSQLLLGIRRANRQQTVMPSSVISSDSMHIGVLAAAAHAAANHSPFTVFYNPRTSLSEFVVPFAKYNKALYGTQVSVGMRFRMMFETEESSVRRYMGTITGISDLDPVRWPNSPWRNLQVGWDESSAGERQNRVSIWEIETLATPFFICPPPLFRLKRPRQPGLLGEETNIDSTIKRSSPWLMEGNGTGDFQNLGIGLEQWTELQQRSEIINPTVQLEYYRSMAAAALQEFRSSESSKDLCIPQQTSQAQQIHFSGPQQHQSQQQEHLPRALQQQFQQRSHYQHQQLPAKQLLLQQSAPLQQLQQHPPLQQSQQQQHLSVQQLKQSQQTLPELVQLQHQPLQQLQQHPLQTLQQFQQQQAPLLLQQDLKQQQLLPLTQKKPLSMPPPPQQLLPFAQQKPLPVQLQQLQQQHQIQKSPLPEQHECNQSPEYHFRSQQQQLQPVLQHQLAQQHLPVPSQQSQQQEVRQSSPPQTHAQKQSAQHSFCIQQQLQSRQSTQLCELGQLLQSSSNCSHAECSIPVPATSQSGFTESDVSFCSTSTSTNSYPLQNILTRSHHGSVTSEVKSQYANMSRSSLINTQDATFVSDLVQEPPCTSWFTSMKDSSHAELQAIPNPQSGEIETSSSLGDSFSLTQVNAVVQQDLPTLPNQSTSFWFRNTSQGSEGHADSQNNMLFCANMENSLVGPTTTSPLLATGFSGGKDAPCQASAESILSSFSTSKDIQPQISSASMLCSRSFAVPDLPDSSDVASILELDDSSIMQRGSWKQLPPPVRTYTKVYKLGSVGRSIDISRYKNYDELRCELARMFGLEGQLEDPKRSGWQLVFVDNENDILLVGDDPWEEFLSCVRYIKILSPSEVLQMSQEGMELLNPTPMQLQTSSCSDDGNVWRDHHYQNSTNPSLGSFGH
eukprot:Gb_02925 [translate_table: standard]